MSDQAPTVYTKHGTVLESTLRYEHAWEDNAQMTVLREFWFDIQTGELVKNNVHALAKKGMEIGAAQASIA